MPPQATLEACCSSLLVSIPAEFPNDGARLIIPHRPLERGRWPIRPLAAIDGNERTLEATGDETLSNLNNCSHSIAASIPSLQ